MIQSTGVTGVLRHAFALCAVMNIPALAHAEGGWTLNGGAAARYGAGIASTDGARQVQAADLDAYGDATRTLAGGFEFGFAGRVRWQLDNRNREANGGRAGDCPTILAGCPGIEDGGIRRPLRSPVSGLVTGGPVEELDSRLAVEQAYGFVSNSFGEIRFGLVAGAAAGEVDPLKPALDAFGSADAELDLAGLNTIRTRNDITGFAPKIVVKTQRVLGLAAELSWTPRVFGSGTDWQAPRNREGGPASPELEHAIEARASFELNAFLVKPRAFVSWARAADRSGLAAFGDYSAVSAGAALSVPGWEAGAQGLLSNNSVAGSSFTERGAGYRSARVYLGSNLGPFRWTAEAATARDELADATETGVGLSARFGFFDRFSAGIFGLLQQRDSRNSPETFTRQRGASLGFELRAAL